MPFITLKGLGEYTDEGAVTSLAIDGFSPTAPAPFAIIMIAKTIDARTVDIIFESEVNPITVVDVSNYVVTPALDVLSVAILTLTPNTVRLTTSRQDDGVTYTITASSTVLL